MQYSLRQKTLLWAIYSRAFVLVLQLFVHFAINQETLSNTESEETASNVTFEWVRSVDEKHTETFTLADAISFAFGGLFVSKEADVQHNLHIADNGYTYEPNLAYFPLYPLMVKGLSSAFHWLGTDLVFTAVGNEESPLPSHISICALVVNFALFLLAVDKLYALSRIVLRDEYLAYKSALFFCISPASVIFTAPLAETALAAFTFASMITIEKGMGLFTGVYLALATSCRACGLVNLSFVLYNSMKSVATQTILFVRHKKKYTAHVLGKSKQGGKVEKPSPWPMMGNIITTAIVPGIWCIVASLAPFAAFQWFAFATFCRLEKSEMARMAKHIRAYGKEHELLMPGDPNRKPVWCSQDPPIPYFHLGGGATIGEPFKHWKVEEWPHYVAAAPAIVLVLWQVSNFFRIHKRYCFRLGLVDNAMLGISKPKTEPANYTRALPRETLVYLAHAFVLAAAGAVSVPLQISGRLLLTSSPVLYWIAALATTSANRQLVEVSPDQIDEFPKGQDADKNALLVESGRNLHSAFSTLILTESTSSDLANWTKIYFLGFTTLATLLFAANFPGI